MLVSSSQIEIGIFIEGRQEGSDRIPAGRCCLDLASGMQIHHALLRLHFIRFTCLGELRAIDVIYIRESQTPLDLHVRISDRYYCTRNVTPVL